MSNSQETPNSDPNETAKSAPDFNLEEINALLAKEDPAFFQNLKDLDSLPADANVEIHSLEIDNELKENADTPFFENFFSQGPRRARWRMRFKKFMRKDYWRHVALPRFLRLLRRCGQIANRPTYALLHALAYMKVAWKEMSSAKRAQVLFLLTVTIGSAVTMVYLNAKFWNRLFPPVEIVSLEDYADNVLKFETDAKTDSFYSPLRAPDFVTLLKRFKVRLKSVPAGPDPLGLLEMYLEPSGQEVAVEIQARESEIIDALARVAEGYAIPELATANGKALLKAKMRDRVNELLTRGYVRKIYFHSVLLRSSSPMTVQSQ